MHIPKTLTVGFLLAVILVSSITGGLLASGPSAADAPPLTQRPEVSRSAETRDAALSTPQLIDAARARGRIDAATAHLYLAYALAAPDRLPAEYQGAVPWDGTLPLLRLQESVTTMAAGAERTTVEELLAGVCGGSTGDLTNEKDSTHFYVEYGTIYALSIDDYTDSLETAWGIEVTDFEWAAPPLLAPGGRYHVRIDTLEAGLYGYVTNVGTYAGLVGDNPATTWNDVDAYATCMVLNQDFDQFPGTAQQALEATVAHEFNHSIQFGYGALSGTNVPDDALVEGGASWMEDEVFDSSNDNYNYLWPDFDMCMGQYTAYPYPYWITLRGLTEPYGTGTPDDGEQVMQDFWEETSKGTGDMLGALSTALANKGTTLADAYHAYAIAVKFNKTCGDDHVYPYCFEEAAGYLSVAGATPVHGSIVTVGGSVSRSVPDNYALNWISLPTAGEPYSVTLQNTSASGGQLRASVVCDTGTALAVEEMPDVVGAGDSTSLADYDPTGCTSVAAVITNQAQTTDDPGYCSNRNYTLTTAYSAVVRDNMTYLPLVPRNWPKLLINGNFEDGPTGWQEYSSNGFDLIMEASDLYVAPHSGEWAVWLGGWDLEISYIQQQVTVLPSAPYLTYWHWIGSEDACGYDFGSVRIDGSVVDEYDLCYDKNTGGWVKHSVNLGAYAGQTVWLQIRAETDVSENSNLFVDDVSFQASAARLGGEVPLILPEASAPKKD